MSAVARLDLHCHTRHSGDCFVSLERVVRIAAARGVTHLAITDHDSCECRRQNVNKTWPIQLIYGEEVTLANGTHLIALGISEEIKATTLGDALREIRAAGGFALVPHPFKKGSGVFGPRRSGQARGDAELTEARNLVRELADAIEVCNSKLTDQDNQRAFVLARELGKPMTAGSDAHFGYDVGHAVLEFESDGRLADWRELVGSDRSRRVLMNRFVRQQAFDEHQTDTKVNNLFPGIRRFVPKGVRTFIKRTLHRTVYQPRVRRRDFVLDEVRF
jgi:predicted metal-dependent phosphoesterase TrpH